MPLLALRLLAYGAALTIIVGGAAAQAQQPKLEMHRAGVSVDDGSGWYPAVSTKGSFSVRLPIPFNDFTIALDPSTGEVSHVVGGKSSEGIKFSAVEVPVSAKTPTDLATIPKTFSADPANKVSDVSRATKDGMDTLSFSVTGPASSAQVRYIRTTGALYTLTIEYPNAYREVIAAK